MIRTIVIAAAGRGSRMQQLSENKPKHLVSVGGAPFISHVLSAVHQAGFERIIVVVGYHAEQMEAYVTGLPLDITVVNQSAYSADRYGTAIVVEAVEEAVGHEPFVFINGDDLYTPSVLEAAGQDDGLHHIYGMHHPDPTHYGVLNYDADSFLLDIEEKPQEPVSNVINLGLYTFQSDIFPAVHALEPSARGEYEITDAISALAQERRVKVELLDGQWAALNTPEDIKTVEQFLSAHLLHSTL